MLQFLKPHKLIIALVVTICVVLVVMPVMLQTNAESIDETNPDLTLISIDSDVEATYGESLYIGNSDFSQQGNNYQLKTNTFVAWKANDDIAYAYRKYNVGEKGEDYLEASVTVNSPSTVEGGEPHSNSSTGLMLRSGLESDAAEVFVHVRPNALLAVYRTTAGNASTQVQYVNVEFSYPIQLRAVKRGNTVILSYKFGSHDWFNFRYPIGMNAPGPLYAGLASHSCRQSDQLESSFSNLSIKGVGTYEESGDNTSSTTSQVPEYVADDSPATDDVILRETFTDGSLDNTPTTPLNPLWNKPQGVNIINLKGNRVWFKNFTDSVDYLGDVTWTDYLVNVDVRFSENCNPDPESATNTVKLHARHTDIPFYGHSDYTAVISEGHKIGLYKRTYMDVSDKSDGYLLGSVDLRVLLGDANYSCLGDGKFHTFGLKAFDNQLTVYWDGKAVVEATDNGSSDKTALGEKIFTKGSVGIATYETSVHLDNLTVRKLMDTFGGSYDNEIGGNWNLPIPDYVNEWNTKGY